MRHRTGRLAAASHPRDLLLELVERGPPTLGGAPHHRGSHDRIDESIGLHQVHPSADHIVGEGHLGTGLEQRFSLPVDDAHFDHQTVVWNDLDKGPPYQALPPMRAAHTDVEAAAHVHLHHGVRHSVGFRAEPALYVVG